MDIYVLKDGQRRGPFLAFKLRELLEDKEFLPTDQAWIEGMEAWAPIKDIEALSHCLPADPLQPPPLPSPEEWTQRSAAAQATAEAQQEVKTRQVRAWMRWLARMLDDMLWFVTLWALACTAGQAGVWDFVLRQPTVLLAAAVLWIPAEAWLLHRFTTTPGKWIFGIRVTDDLGQPLQFKAALKRSALVMATGNGMGLPTLFFIPLIQWVIAWIRFQKTGVTGWDFLCASSVVHRQTNPLGFVAAGLFVGLWIAAGSWISLQAPLPVDLKPEERDAIQTQRNKFNESWNQLQQSRQAKGVPGT
jgi:uncharacterized RDD family membrane protein YckC